MIEIIAEAAQGYEGNPTLAKLIAKGAVKAGADAVKFQLVYADELATPDYVYYKLFQNLEMSHESWQAVRDEIKTAGKKIYLDVFGERSLTQAIALEADGVKIHSTDFFNKHLVRSALDSMSRVFVSFGGISAQELEDFIKFHKIKPDQQVCFMYGFQSEPTPIASNNLLRFNSLRSKFPNYQLGFMDHSDGATNDSMALSLMALPLGVKCIEKHISLDRHLELEDFVSALPPEAFGNFVKQIKHLEGALGTENLEPTALELEYRRKALKVVVANRSLKKGEKIDVKALSLKRVAQRLESGFVQLDQVVDRTLNTDVQINQQLVGEMFL